MLTRSSRIEPRPRKLAAYRAKRDFGATAEPSGGGSIRPAEYPRYVIHKHEARRLHFDLRLELDGVFKSWAVTRGPSLDPRDKRLAVEVEDHPLEYGDFEGTIPEGQYGAGTVMVWDRGFWIPEGTASAADALHKGELKFTLAGERLRGSWVLVRMKHDRDGGKRANWLLIKHRDEFARSGNGTVTEIDESVASGRSMAEIRAGRRPGPRPFMLASTETADARAVWNSRPRGEPARVRRQSGAADPPKTAMPRFIAPELCRSVIRPPPGEDWVHEIKLDGYRMQLRIQAGRVAMLTRKGLDWTERFPEIAAAAAALPDAIVDGEVVALDGSGVSRFDALQAALSRGQTHALVYFAFDLPFAEGEDLRSLPLCERKLRLKALLRHLPKQNPVRFLEHVAGHGEAMLESARRLGLEGIVSKRLASPYRSGRTGDWTKAKCRPGQEVVIGGWSGGKSMLRSLLVGVHRDGRLVYAGRVGTGFDASTSRALLKRLNRLATDIPPFTGSAAPRRERDVTWVVPRLVAEIEFSGWTDAGMVRAAAFKGLREDKPASEVRAEPAPSLSRLEPSIRAKRSPSGSPTMATSRSGSLVMGINISKPAKVLWPAEADGRAVTKLDLARYLEAVGPWMIEHLKGRPCSVIRAPDGIKGEQFFQRHAMPGLSDLVDLVKASGEHKPYIQIDRVDGLVSMAQLAAVEFHPWNCAPYEPAVPGRLIFDLDPAPDVAFDSVIAAAKELRDRLAAIGLVAFCKTTGGKGLHVVTPLAPERDRRLGWREAKAFTQAISAAMAADSPKLYLTRMTKKLRQGRIFIDYLRNDRLATAVAPLSPRARPGAPVSMPLNWSQLRSGLDPKRFTLWTASKLMAQGKAWQDYAKAARPLEPAIRRLVGAKKSTSTP
ncbi:MAG TPA: DNA ligase D [Hyphomicrobiaceae bacterium]|nr:DNA ligase D [Hyphomicrobiaceae bacterium]